MSSAPSVVCVGETLWDVLPGGRFIGGAPFNVAAHLAKLGLRAWLITRLGSDALGREAASAAATHGVDVSALQFDDALPTGEARAVLDSSGSASYSFLSPAAWDALVASPLALAAARESDALVFGTLGQRASVSAASIMSLARVARFRVFDPNLRAPHIDRELTLRSLALAHLVKLNEGECAIFGEWLGCASAPDALQRALQRGFGVSSLCITRGPAGALWYREGRWLEQAAFPCAVVDTVGAGDSFLAMLLGEWLQGAEPAVALRRAARLASLVASRPGAVPDYDAAALV
jgi:fructokinase